MPFYVYKLWCRSSGKVYIGKTNDLDRRANEHRSEAKRGRRNQRLYNAIRKYGWSDFEMYLLTGELATAEAAYQAEEFFIALFNAKGRRGYNSTNGGEGTRGLSVEGRRRLAAHARTRTGEKNGFFGRTHSQEARQGIAKARSRFQGEQHPRWGKLHSDQTKRKISRSQKARNHQWSALDRLQMSRHQAGEKSNTAKITNEQAGELRHLFANGTPAKELQAIFSLSKASVYRIINRQTFKEC